MKKPFRIAINALTLPAKMAGIGHYTRMLLQHLLAVDPSLEITVFTSRSAATGFEGLAPEILFRTFDVDNIGSKVFVSQMVLPFLLRPFDVVHSVGNVAVLASPIPQVVTIHDLCQRVFPQRFGAAKRAYLNVGQALTARLDVRIISVSHSTERDLERYHPRLAGRIFTVHSACKFQVDEAETETRRDFLFVGTLEPGKNLETALAAMEIFRKDVGSTFKLHVVGALGWMHSHIPALIAKLGLEGQVVFHGYLDEEGLRQQYKSAGCLVFPSIYEGFGFPILEAQSQGCPVLSADNSSLREVGGEACLYFQSRDAGALAGILGRITRESGLAAELRKLGFENLRRFDWRATAEKTLKAYKAATLGAD